jgi:hypothetical protein
VNVRGTLVGRQPYLRPRLACTGQCVHDHTCTPSLRQCKRKQCTLIESAFPTPRPAKRDRYKHRSPSHESPDFRVFPRHFPGQRRYPPRQVLCHLLRQTGPAIVFQLVYYLPAHAFRNPAERASARNVLRELCTPSAFLAVRGVAAANADRRWKHEHACPAARANQRLRAGRSLADETHARHEEVEDTREDRRHDTCDDGARTWICVTIFAHGGSFSRMAIVRPAKSLRVAPTPSRHPTSPCDQVRFRTISKTKARLAR